MNVLFCRLIKKKKSYYSINIFPFLYIFVVFLLIFNGPLIFGCGGFVLFDLTNSQLEHTERVTE